MTKSALIIDDDRANISLCELILTERGYNVHSAKELNTSQDYFAEEMSLFFVDYHLPDGYGTEAVSAIRERYPESVICMVSMDDDADVIREGMRAGINIFMVKPATPSLITDLINEVEDGILTSDTHQLITRHGKRSYAG